MAKLKSWKEHYWHTVPCMRKRIEDIVRRADVKGKTVLEVGCNEGFVTKALVESGAGRAVAIDYDPEMVKKAKDLFDIEVFQGDINKLDFPDNSFDIAIGGEVLEHIDNPMVGLQELFRVAKEKVIITVPVGEYWLGELTHMWELGGAFIEHDKASLYEANKDILILCWTRKRDKDFKDIPPFNTAEIKKKYNIS